MAGVECFANRREVCKKRLCTTRRNCKFCRQPQGLRKLFLYHVVYVRFAGSHGLQRVLHPPQPFPAGEVMRSCKRFQLCKPSATILFAKIFSPIPLPPLPRGEGGNFLNFICREASPPAPRVRTKCLAKKHEICKISFNKFILSFGVAKEWGCGGRNFGAPDGSAPTKE